MSIKQTGIVWFRNDLRTHDQPALFESTRECGIVIPIFIFDPRAFKQGCLSLPRTGPKRLAFQLETLMQLRRKLQLLGSDLVIKYGLPEHILPKLAKEYNVTAIYYNREPAPYEQLEEKKLLYTLKGVTFHAYDGGFLLPTGQLPYAVNNIPDVFTDFRKTVEAKCLIPPPIDDIQYIPPLPDDIETGDFSRLSLFLPGTGYLSREAVLFKGGEYSAHQRLKNYIWDSWAIAHYYDTRNELDGTDNASRISPWLANGSISPRYIQDSLLLSACCDC